jgi:hypothetical protein
MNLDDKIKEAFARHEADVQPGPGTWRGVEKAIARGHKTRMALTVATAAMAITAAIVAIPRLGSNPKPFDSGPTAAVRVKPAQPRLIGKVPAHVFALAAGSNSLWGLESDANPVLKPRSLIRIDPSVRKVMARIPVGYVPQAVAADDHAIWVTNGSGCMEIVSCGDASYPPTFRFPYQNSVMRIDPRTNKVVASIRVTEPQDVAIGFGSVWVTTGNGTQLIRIDPASNRVIATVRAGTTGALSRIAIGTNAVYLTVPQPSSGGDESVLIAQVDPATNKFVNTGRRVSVGSPLPDIAAGFGSVWVTTDASTTPSALYRFDQSNPANASTIALPDAAPVGLDAVTAGEGYVWAVSARGYLWKVDPTTHRHDNPTTIGEHPPVSADAVVTGFGFVWVASGDGQIWQLAP